MQQEESLCVFIPVFVEHLFFIHRDAQMVIAQRGQEGHIFFGKVSRTPFTARSALRKPMADIDSPLYFKGNSLFFCRRAVEGHAGEKEKKAMD